MQKRYFLILAACLVFFALDFFINPAFATGKTKADMYYQNAIQLHGAAMLEEVFEQYARSAELGHAIAQYNLAMMYSNGESVYVDYQQAVYWFKKSAEQEFAPAQYRLGEMYYFEKGGLPRDLVKAIELFNKSASQGDPDAQMNLALLYGTGEGLPADTEKALFWLERAGEGGHESAHAYYNLLSASTNGKFTEDQKKRYWTEKAAELGIREAQEALAIMNKSTQKE
jgi:TPR repeat protein